MMEFEFPKHNLDVDFDDDTGFPFDDQRLNPPQPEPSSSSQPPTSSSGYSFGGRGDDNRLHFEDHLRDIAARYPEFAEHIRPAAAGPRTAFPRERVRRDPWGRDEFDFGREFDIPAEFESRFARPREFYPPNTQTYSSSPPCQPESRPPTHPQSSTPPPPTGPKPAPTQAHSQIASNTQIPTTTGKVGTFTIPNSNPTPTGQGIQQSNTVDLGQVQPPSAQGANEGAGECRGQRSMSAPPTNGGRAATGGKRYVSSIQIPVLQQRVPQGIANNQLGGGNQSADMGASNSTPKQPSAPQPAQHTPNRPNEYVIPIHIEGRDEPITPKQNYQQPPAQNQNSQQYMQPPASGQNQPLLFNTMKDQFKQEQAQKEQQQKFHEQQQQTEFEQQPERPQIVKPSPLEMIQLIQKDVSELMSRVDKFAGRPKDKDYIYLDEMLTRNLLKLDNIETEGKDAIRQARREAIKCIEGCIGILEAKAKANAANQDKITESQNTVGDVENTEIPVVEEIENNGGDKKETAAAADVSVT